MDVELNYNESQHIYKNQLEQMREFGFTNDEENIRALIVNIHTFNFLMYFKYLDKRWVFGNGIRNGNFDARLV